MMPVESYSAGGPSVDWPQQIANRFGISVGWATSATDFRPYPGFTTDPYKEYSAPWFETHKILRGGCWATRSRLIRNTWRNFYTPDRGDVFAGFRTCARA